MKFFIVFAALFAVAMSASLPAKESLQPGVIRYEFDNIGVEGYKYALETEDGKSVSEEGTIKNLGKDAGDALSVHGRFSWVAPDGVTYTVEYIADENGFQPQGAHLPQLPQLH